MESQETLKELSELFALVRKLEATLEAVQQELQAQSKRIDTLVYWSY